MFESFVIHATLSDPTAVHHTCCPKPGPQMCLADFTNDPSNFCLLWIQPAMRLGLSVALTLLEQCMLFSASNWQEYGKSSGLEGKGSKGRD